MGLFGNLIKGALNVVIAPVVVVTDVLQGDFDNSGKIVENIVDSIEDGVEDLTEGKII